MNYFAGNPSNTSKFMQASFNPTEFANLSQGLEALQEAAALNADFKRGYAALGGFSKAQERLAQYEAEKQIGALNRDSQKRSNFMSGLGTAISLGAGAFHAAGALGNPGGGNYSMSEMAADPSIFVSDRSTKENIKPIEDALSILRELKPVSYNYKAEYSKYPERLHHGFIAQEYETVLPDATYKVETIDKLGIDTNDLIGILVRANQQLETRIARLEAKQVLTAV